MNKWKARMPMILSIAASAGTGLTTFFAIKDTRKVVKDESKIDVSSLTTIEKLKFYTKHYISTIVSGTATLFCIAGSNFSAKSNCATIATAYGVANRLYSDYREGATALGGKEFDNKVIEYAANKYIDPNAYVVPDDHYISACAFFEETSLNFDGINEEKVEFYEPFTKTWFISTPSKVVQAEYFLNRDLSLGGTRTVKDFLDLLGIIPAVSKEDLEMADEFGWDVEVLFEEGSAYWIEFNHVLSEKPDGAKYYIIDTPFEAVSLKEIYG